MILVNYESQSAACDRIVMRAAVSMNDVISEHVATVCVRGSRLHAQSVL